MPTIPVVTVVALLWAHFFADFVLQSDWMAKNKSSQIKPLLIHILVYTFAIFTFTLFFTTPLVAIAFAVANGALHCATDAVSSRISGHFYRQGDNHNFFVVIGFDQFIHVAALLWTWSVMIPA